MNMTNHTRLDLVEGGSIFKQGDHVDLAFVPRDYQGRTVDLTNKNISVAIWDSRGIMLEGPATYDSEANLIRLTIKQILPHGDFQIEFTATDPNDLNYRKKFPSGDFEGKIYIKPSADDLDFVGISVTTVSQLRTEQEQKQQQFELAIVPQVDELKQRVEEGIGAFTEDTEVLDARMGETNLRQFNEKTIALLAETGQRLSDIAVNLKSYGANADGVTDDTAIVQQVIDLLNSDKGGTITGPPNAVYAIAGTVKLKSNVFFDLNGGKFKRIGITKNARILENANFGSTEIIDKNMGIKNMNFEGTGKTVGVTDQGSAIGLYCIDNVLIEKVRTENTNGDGIQWRRVKNLKLRDVEIGDYGRNGISPTSGDAVWENVIVYGNPIAGANPGKDVDAETNKPSSEELGINIVNNLRCKNVTLIDFFTPEGGDFSQEWVFDNTIIGNGFNALKIKSTNKTVAKRVIINETCSISAAGSAGSAIQIDNVSGVVVNAPKLLPGSATGSTSGIQIVGEVNNLILRDFDINGFTRSIYCIGTLNYSKLKNLFLERTRLLGIGNDMVSSLVKILELDTPSTVNNRFDINTKIETLSLLNGATINDQRFEKNRVAFGALYSNEVKVPDGTTHTLVVPIPPSSGIANGRLLTLIAGYSHVGNSNHWASLITTIRVGDTHKAQAAVIAKNSSGVTNDIAVTNVTDAAVTLTLTHQYAGILSATVIG
ncbi:hypothetical protein [Planococcus sp. SSTMD024]|uniref:hypothetical protein n=1 Tax=Planococcus sp. SSTMD024 TaxID=3242163 RepID=UPI00351EAD4E